MMPQDEVRILLPPGHAAIEEYCLADLSDTNGVESVKDYVGALLIERHQIEVEVFGSSSRTRGFVAWSLAMVGLNPARGLPNHYIRAETFTCRPDQPFEGAVSRALHRNVVLILPYSKESWNRTQIPARHLVERQEVALGEPSAGFRLDLRTSTTLATERCALMVCHDGDPVYVASLIG